MPMNSGSLRENSLSELNVLFEVAGLVFTRTSISEFVYENEINTIPKGSFVLKDSGQLDSMGLQSGSNGFIYFSNTSDGNEIKRMSLPIYLEDVEVLDVKDIFFYYRIKWIAGNLDQLNVKSGDAISQANSIDAMKKIFELRGANVSQIETTKPTDTMNWLIVNKNMWQQLDMVVNRSFLSNDYIFWAWDDVNNVFKISSIGTEFKKNDSNLLVRTIDVVTSSENSKEVMDSTGVVVWKFNTYKKYNALGSSYKKLFPNVSFLGIPSGVIKSGGIKRENFITLLKTLNDTKLDDVLSQTGLGSTQAVFGDLILRKHSPNGHDLYSFADIYREYKISTFAKTFMCQIYNSVGPAIGSTVSLMHVFNSSEGSIQIDPRFSDRYLVKKKIVQYDGYAINNMGRKIEATTNYITTLILVSDNYTDGIDNINSILDKVNV